MFILTSSLSTFSLAITATAAPVTLTYTYDNQPTVIMEQVGVTQNTVAMFREDYGFAMKDGWDGGNAVAVSKKSLDNLQVLLEKRPFLLGSPEVTPIVRGGINFCWQEGSKYLYLESRNDGVIHIYYDIDGDKWEKVGRITDVVISSKLATALLKLYGLNLVYVKTGKSADSFITA